MTIPTIRYISNENEEVSPPLEKVHYPEINFFKVDNELWKKMKDLTAFHFDKNEPNLFEEQKLFSDGDGYLTGNDVDFFIHACFKEIGSMYNINLYKNIFSHNFYNESGGVNWGLAKAILYDILHNEDITDDGIYDKYGIVKDDQDNVCISIDDCSQKADATTRKYVDSLRSPDFSPELLAICYAVMPSSCCYIFSNSMNFDKDYSADKENDIYWGTGYPLIVNSWFQGFPEFNYYSEQFDQYYRHEDFINILSSNNPDLAKHFIRKFLLSKDFSLDEFNSWSYDAQAIAISKYKDILSSNGISCESEIFEKLLCFDDRQLDYIFDLFKESLQGDALTPQGKCLWLQEKYTTREFSAAFSERIDTDPVNIENLKKIFNGEKSQASLEFFRDEAEKRQSFSVFSVFGVFSDCSCSGDGLKNLCSALKEPSHGIKNQ